MCDDKGQTALMLAAYEGHSKCVELLIKAGADVNVTDNAGGSALHVQRRSKTFQIECVGIHTCVKLLLRSGAKINITDQDAMNALTSYVKESQRCELFEPKIAMLLFVAGETVDETLVQKIPPCLKPSNELSLKSICRNKIRKHLSELDLHENLFVRVPRLAPHITVFDISYLLYDVPERW